MAFTPLDYGAWERREYLEVFGQASIYMTAEVDISGLYRAVKDRGLRLYPALVYCAARVINGSPEFRYGYDQRRRVGIWDVVHPYYTVPRRDRSGLFSMKCTPFAPDFGSFYRAFTEDYARAETCGRLLCDDALPPNICGVSIVPGTRFSAFSFGGGPKEDLTPFTLFGRLRREGERVTLPVGAEFAHAVNDGLHISRFFAGLEAEAARLL